jgi:hypothetical protein
MGSLVQPYRASPAGWCRSCRGAPSCTDATGTESGQAIQSSLGSRDGAGQQVDHPAWSNRSAPTRQEPRGRTPAVGERTVDAFPVHWATDRPRGPQVPVGRPRTLNELSVPRYVNTPASESDRHDRLDLRRKPACGPNRPRHRHERPITKLSDTHWEPDRRAHSLGPGERGELVIILTCGCAFLP